MHTKGPSPVHHDGRGLRIGIIHARWNDKIIEPLLAGTKAKLLECGVQESNIVVQSVPGSWELPLAVQRYVASPYLRAHGQFGPRADQLAPQNTGSTRPRKSNRPPRARPRPATCSGAQRPTCLPPRPRPAAPPRRGRLTR